MRTLVRFRGRGADYALPVESVAEVRSASELTPLPAPKPDVAGLMPHRDGALTVLSVLDDAGAHVLVVDDGEVSFGLLVDEVVGVERVDPDRIGAPPRGQARDAVTGVFREQGRLVLVLDTAALRGRLGT